jgi:hypothetical protein
MLRLLLILTLIASASAQASPWFDGAPDFTDEESRSLAEKVLQAHGGMQPMNEAKSLQFSFFTKMIGGSMPFYSFEAVDLATGDAYIEWPFWDATIAWKDGELWSQQWPMPMPAGFFIRLTTSFITLPWQINADGANIGPVSQATLPEDDEIYDVLRITFDQRSPSMPGTFYDMFIDPESGLMKAIRFDINHPGMVANPAQPLGPNVHVFGEYKKYGGLVIPTFYKTYGAGSANGGGSNAYHFAWDVRLDRPFDSSRLVAPEDAVLDSVSMKWWQSNEQNSFILNRNSAIAIDPISTGALGGAR